MLVITSRSTGSNKMVGVVVDYDYDLILGQGSRADGWPRCLQVQIQ